MEAIEFSEVIKNDPDLFYITRSRTQNGVICYSEGIFQKNTLINSLAWIYQNYFLKSVTVFLPKINIKNPDYLVCDLETLEQTNIQSGTVVIFGFADLIFGNLVKINKRRLNTILKNIVKKATVVILSSCSLKVLDLDALDHGTTKNSFEYIELEKPLINYRTLMDHISLFDLMDPKLEEYKNNVDTFVEMVSDFVTSGKRVYMSLNLITSRLLEIETKLKNLEHSVLRKDSNSADIVINSAKTCANTYLVAKYDIYIFAPSHFDNPIEIVSQFKNIFGNDPIEIYLDTTKIDILEKCLKEIFTTSHVPRLQIKDSQDFDTYSELVDSLDQSQEIVLASDDYYLIQSSDEIQELDLNNLSPKDYDKIRYYTKIYLLNKYDLEVKTIQLAAVCSPKDRSKKLNSLSNKISSFDYRCNCTCEIFKDYTIGIIIWNETFANRKSLNLKLLKDCGYVYQTTYGKWKYTIIQ
jgi:hypothetical protein